MFRLSAAGIDASVTTGGSPAPDFQRAPGRRGWRHVVGVFPVGRADDSAQKVRRPEIVWDVELLEPVCRGARWKRSRAACRYADNDVT
jgi:hypothetical protein